MVIRNGLTKIQLMMVLAAALISYLGCGSDDESIVEPDTSMEPDPVTSTGSLKGTIEKIDGVIVDLEGFEKQEIAVGPIPAGKTIPLEVAVVTLPTVRGLLLDQITKSPLSDVRVQLTDEAGAILETPTTTSGVFEFKGVSANQRLTITIDSDKYKKQEFVVGPIPVGETVKLEVRLIPLIAQLPKGDGLTVGLKAPDFNLPDSDWEMIALADYVGKKKVVLVFDRGGGW